MTIPERLKQLRTERKISMRVCAEGAGIPYNTYQKYEYGEREISIIAVKKLANFYNVSTDFLLGSETNSTAPDPITQLSEAETEEEFLKKYFMLEPKLRASVREKMQEALKAQEDGENSTNFIIRQTTIGAELDRMEAEQENAKAENNAAG